MRIVKEQKGATLILIAIMTSVFFSLLALVLDGGNLYLEKARVQKIADAAALSGAQELPASQMKAEAKAKEAIELNHDSTSTYSVQFNAELTTIEVTGRKKVNLIFAPVLGIDNPTVEARAAVDLMPLTSGVRAVPLGVEYDANLQYGDKQYLKVGDSTYGNFGALALSGPGAKDYETDLRDGYELPINIHDKLNTQSGAIVQKTINAVKTRISKCPDAKYDNYSSDCSRVVLVPVFKTLALEEQKVKQVEVVGFASFFIESVSSANTNAEVIGTFIQKTHNGDSSQGVPNYGTYGYKLTR